MKKSLIFSLALYAGAYPLLCAQPEDVASEYLSVFTPVANQSIVGVDVQPETLKKLAREAMDMTRSDHIQVLYFDRIIPEMEAYRETRDKNHLLRVRAYAQGVLDLWISCGRTFRVKDEEPAMRVGHPSRITEEFFHRAPMMESFLVMRGAGVLDPQFQKDFQQMVEDHYTTDVEIGPNNRAASFASGCALAADAFPTSAKASEWIKYAETVWDSWYEGGDSYEPAYVMFHARFLELGKLLGKSEELRSDKMRKTYDRYLSDISPSGAAVTAGDGSPYDAGSFQSLMAAIMGVCPTPQYLWGLKAAFLWDPKHTEADFAKEFPQYAGMEAEPPEWSAHVTYRWPATWHQPERLVLCPSWRKGSPYAAFWINDNTNSLYHGGTGDTRGDLTHYEADGVLLIADRGRYDWPAWNNTFVVSQPDAEYPYPQVREIVDGRWYRGSANLRPLTVSSPSGPYERIPPLNANDVASKLKDSRNPIGYINGNPDAPSGKNDTVPLKEVFIEFAVLPPTGESKEKIFDGRNWWGGYEYRNVCPSDKPVDVLVRDLAVAGPAGEKTILPLDEIPRGMKMIFFPPKDPKAVDFTPEQVSGQALKELASVVRDPETGHNALRVKTRIGRTRLIFPLPGNSYNLAHDYNRINLSYKYLTSITNWSRVPIRLGFNGDAAFNNLHLDQQQGGLLTAADARSEGGDSFGTVSYRSIWTYDSSWTRSAVLTEEGIMVIRDEFYPGKTADGLVGGPVWHLPSAPRCGSLAGQRLQKDEAWHDANAFGSSAEWFDSNMKPEYSRGKGYDDPRGEAVSRSAAQTNLFIAFGSASERENGVQFQPKHWKTNDYAVFSKARLHADQPVIFVSVLVPHSASFDPSLLTDDRKGNGFSIVTDKNGQCEVRLDPQSPQWTYPPLTVDIGPDQSWKVVRGTGK